MTSTFTHGRDITRTIQVVITTRPTTERPRHPRAIMSMSRGRALSRGLIGLPAKEGQSLASRGAYLIGAVTLDDYLYGEHQNVDIEPDGPIQHVVAVQFNAL